MSRLRPENDNARAKRLTNLYIKKGFNQTRVAKIEGVTRSAINKRLKRKPVQDMLQRFLDSPKLDQALIASAVDGLRAEKDISCNIIAPNGEGMKDANSMTKDFVKVPDHNVRHKYWHDLLTAKGKLKLNGNGTGASVVNIIYAYRKPAEETCPRH